MGASTLTQYNTISLPSEYNSTKFRFSITDSAGSISLWNLNISVNTPGRKKLIQTVADAYVNLDSARISAVNGVNIVPYQNWVLQAEYSAYETTIDSAKLKANDKNSTMVVISNAQEDLDRATAAYDGIKKAGNATVEFTALIEDMLVLLKEGLTYHLRYRVKPSDAVLDPHNTKVALGQNADATNGNCCGGDWDLHRKLEDYKEFVDTAAALGVNGYNLAWIAESHLVDSYKAAIAAGKIVNDTSSSINEFSAAVTAIRTAKTALETGRTTGPRESSALADGANIAHYIAYVNENRADNWGSAAAEKAMRNSVLTSVGTRTESWVDKVEEFYFSQEFNVSAFALASYGTASNGRIQAFDLEYLDMDTGEWKMAFQRTGTTNMAGVGTSGTINGTTAGVTFTFDTPCSSIGWRFTIKTVSSDASVYAYRFIYKESE